MSILKGILHHWNKTNNAYDTIHPETESAQVTDWNSGIVNTLASTALGSLVSTLSSDSLLAKLIGKVLDATGVKYSMSTNGYICFGSLFGGLIIQWGKVVTANVGIQNVSITLPIAVSNILVAVCSAYTKQLDNDHNSGQVCDFTNKSLTLTIDNGAGVWLAICK